MTAFELYQELNKTSWRTERPAVRWLACRYYTGVDSLAQLRAMSQPQVIGYDDQTIRPILTQDEVDRIILLR